MASVGSSSVGTTWPEERHSGELLDIPFDTIVPLTPSPFNPTKTIPIAELLAPSFLSRYDDETLTSYNIWDYCLVELNEKYNGENLAVSVEDLLTAFEPLLAPKVMGQIRNTLDALAHSILGVKTVLLPSLDSVLGNILLDLKERAYVPYNPPTDKNNEWEEVP